MRIAYPLALLTAILVGLTGCVSTQSSVSSALPISVQQNIRTASVQEVAYEFVPAEGADVIEVEFPTRATSTGGKTSFRFNEPMQNLFDQLIATKFARVDPSSDNRIKVQMSIVGSDVVDRTYVITALAHVTTVFNGETDQRSISFTQRVEGRMTSSFPVAWELPSAPLEEFMVSFVVAVDRYIDSIFGTR